MRYIIATLFSLVFTAAVAGDFEDGVAAYRRQDYATALTKFLSAAQEGNRNAQTLVGMMYYEGKGAAQDYKEAARWIKLAAQQGVADSQLNLGAMYDKGHGVAQDSKEAIRWYKLAAQQGETLAQYNLAFMYYHGKGVLQDYVRAHMWFNIAAVGGDSDSTKSRETTASKMTAQQVEQAQRMARECMNSKFTKCD